MKEKGDFRLSDMKRERERERKRDSEREGERQRERREITISMFFITLESLTVLVNS